MRSPAFLLMLTLIQPAARAGFEHPLEQANEQSYVTPHASTAASRTSTAASSVATTTMAAAKSTPATAQDARSPASRHFVGPLPSPQNLPDARHMRLAPLQLPPARKPLATQDGLAPLQLRSTRSAQIHAFSRQARMLPLSSLELGTTVRGKETAAKYSAALALRPHRVIRTPVQITIQPIAKILQPPRGEAYLNQVKRIDALFEGLEGHYARAMLALWELSEAKSNDYELRARDSLFAGLMSKRMGWESVAANLYESSFEQGVQEQERHAGILWRELASFASAANVDRVVARADVDETTPLPQSAAADFAMAKRLLRENDDANSALFEAKLPSGERQDRMKLLRAMAQIQPGQKTPAASQTALRELAETGVAPVKNEATLALARSLLRDGGSAESLDFYRAVVKDGRNRLPVMTEQAYAEFLTGHHAESLGKAVGVESAYFQYGYAPDIHLVETLSRKANCDFGGAEKALHRLADRYVPELQGLEALRARQPSPHAFYAELISYHGLQNPYRYQRYLLQLPVVMENQKLLNQAEEELDTVANLGIRQKFKDRPPGWEKFATAMRQVWEVRARELKRESAESALTEVGYLATRLRQNFAQAELLSLDVATGASKDFNLQSALNFPVRRPAAVELGKNQFLWPFELEIWEDELDSIRMTNPSKCAIANKK